MSSSILLIEETDAEFTAELSAIKNDIRTEFLLMSKSRRKGFFISLEKALYWLRINYVNNADFRSNFKKRILQADNHFFIEAKDEDDYSAHFIYRNNDNGDKRIKMPWFSDDGFKLLCMVSRSPKAALVRSYYLELEKEYIATLEMERDEFEKKQKHDLYALTSLQSKIEQLNKDNISKQRALDQRDRQIIDYYRQSEYLSYRILQLREVERALNITFDDIPDPTNIMRLDLYEKKYGKPAYIYLVSDKWINTQVYKELNKQYIKEEKSDAMEHTAMIDETLLHYKLDLDIDFTHITDVWLQEMIAHIESSLHEQHLYIYITRRQSTIDYMKLLNKLYFFDDDHYKLFLAQLEENTLTNMLPLQPKFKNKVLNGTFMIDYASTVSTHRDAATRLAYDALKRDVKCVPINDIF
jgi:hypothetical protein